MKRSIPIAIWFTATWVPVPVVVCEVPWVIVGSSDLNSKHSFPSPLSILAFKLSVIKHLEHSPERVLMTWVALWYSAQALSSRQRFCVQTATRKVWFTSLTHALTWLLSQEYCWRTVSQSSFGSSFCKILKSSVEDTQVQPVVLSLYAPTNGDRWHSTTNTNHFTVNTFAKTLVFFLFVLYLSELSFKRSHLWFTVDHFL